ncbi:hypothetical protein [Streptomyces odonnellii]|uniref:hypothetical protein n=1 Tax=Streptomyces odonnellii TaxID=1417980 RepID=UPI000A9C1164|nr:hypothetical protein [Streptomyces odonnellii]
MTRTCPERSDGSPLSSAVAHGGDMNSAGATRSTGSRRLRTPLVLVALMGLTLAGCSDPEPRRAYTIPDDLCGVALSPAVLEPVLPPGDKMSSSKDTLNGLTNCEVVVDKVVVLTTITEWYERGTSMARVLASHMADLEDKASKDGRYVYSDEGGVAKIDCRTPPEGLRDEDPFATVLVRKDLGADEEAVHKLLLAYTDAVGKSPDCNSSDRP